MKPKPKPSLIILIIITVISVSLSPASLVFAEEQGTTCIDDPLLQDEIIPEESNPETTPEEMVFETCASESVGSPQSDAAEAESILEEADTEGVNVDPEDIENKIEDISVEIHPVAEAEQVDSNIEISYSSAFSSDDSFERLAAPAVTVENYGESDRKLKISWSSVYGADGYFVYRSTKKGSGYKLITREEIRYSYVDDGLMPNTAYYYKVKAFRYEEPGDRLYRIEDPYYPGALSSAKRIKTKRTVSDGRDFDKASYRFIDYTSYRKKDVTVTRATDSAAKSIGCILFGIFTLIV